jgi:hypothetical protein
MSYLNPTGNTPTEPSLQPKSQSAWPVLVYFAVLFFALTLWFDLRF